MNQSGLGKMGNEYIGATKLPVLWFAFCPDHHITRDKPYPH